MNFDVMLKTLERGEPLPEWCRHAARTARLFNLEFNAREALPREYDPETLAWLLDNLYLPFECVALEDITSCVILMDMGHLDGKPLVGAHHRRRFIECTSGAHSVLESARDFEPEVQARFRNMVVISAGEIALVPDACRPTSFSLLGHLDFIIVVDDLRQGFGEVVPDPPPEVSEGTLKNACIALQEVMLLNDPSTFILESTPVHVLKKGPPKPLRSGQVARIPRSNERPTYTILKPHEIREKMKLSAPTGDTRHLRPHERRRHCKTLRSEFFRHKRGRKIWVEACWVGPSENTVGNRRYRVVLDH